MDMPKSVTVEIDNISLTINVLSIAQRNNRTITIDVPHKSGGTEKATGKVFELKGRAVILDTNIVCPYHAISAITIYGQNTLNDDLPYIPEDDYCGREDDCPAGAEDDYNRGF